jgi:hypothetical protein
MILIEGLAYTASNASSSFCTLSLPWHECTLFLPDCSVLLQHTSAGLPPIWTPMLVFPQYSPIISTIKKAVSVIYKHILHISKMCHLILLFVSTLLSEITWPINEGSIRSTSRCYKVSPQEHYTYIVYKLFSFDFSPPPRYIYIYRERERGGGGEIKTEKFNLLERGNGGKLGAMSV